jgi:oligopeptide transport system substrate-binding protein
VIRVLAIPFAILVLLAGAIVWSGGGTERRADFAFFNRGDIITLDPNQMSYIQDFRVSYGMREGLYAYDTATLEPVPSGCTGHTLSDDKRVWTFHLRPEAKWSNGDPVVAADYVFAWRRMLEEPNEYSYLFDYIKGTKKYGTDFTAYNAHVREAQAKKVAPTLAKPDFATVGIEGVGSDLRVTLTDPVPFLLDLLAFVPFYPLHAPSMEKFKQVDEVTGATSYKNEFTRPGNVVTNGPYDFVRWDFKRRLQFKKSQTYWDRANVQTETVEMVVNDDPLSMFLAYDAGDVDWISDVQTSFAAELKASGRTDVHAMPVFGTAFLSFNTLPSFLPGTSGASGKNPLNDKRVRQALALAIDRKYIVDNVTRMGEPVATNYIPPGVLPGWQSKPGFGLDIARAQKLLADAGYPGGKGLPRLPMVFNSDNPTRKSLCQVLKNQWQANLGIDVDIQGLELKSYRSNVTEKKYAIAPVAWYGDYMDASTFTDKYLSTSLQNDTGWGSAAYDSLCEQGTKEPDEQKRLRILESAEQLLLEEAPIVPIYVYVHVWMHRDNIKGIYPNPKVQMMFKGLKVNPAS